MKPIIFTITCFLVTNVSFAQVSGESKSLSQSKAPDHIVDFQIPERTDLNYDERCWGHGV